MRRVQALVFRYLTDADFFNMYKPTGTEAGGGGQLYIDFRTSVISVELWQEFFDGVVDLTLTQVKWGPQWDFPIYSLGSGDDVAPQQLRVYQRRSASICIPNQNVNTRGANRVRAWHPSNGFPEPDDPTRRQALPAGLAVYLVRTYENTVWAGWFSNHISAPSPCQDAGSTELLREMLARESEPGHVGFMAFDERSLVIEETNPVSPFRVKSRAGSLHPTRVVTTLLEAPHRPRTVRTREQVTTRHIPNQRRPRTEEEIVESLFKEDEDRATRLDLPTREVSVRIRRRNQGAARDLKELYQHKCQITGDRYSFLNRNGVPYTEVHHLVPLGEGGADDPRNMIVVNPLIHRMLHHASVSPIDLSRIHTRADGSATLTIEINNAEYVIRWKPEHAERVLRHEQET